MTLTERVKRKALDLGFQVVGVSRVTSDRPEAARLAEWLAHGYHGEMGWIGKHSNLVSARHGSWLLLGEVLTTADLAPDEPGADLCGTCTLCIRACPTGAITEPHVVDARRCLSYLTIEQKGQIPEEFQRALGNRIFGCDDCLDVCPYNHQATPTTEPAFRATPLTLIPDLNALARQSAAEFQTAFRHSAVRRTTHEGLHRNVAIARKNAS